MDADGDRRKRIRRSISANRNCTSQIGWAHPMHDVAVSFCICQYDCPFALLDFNRASVYVQTDGTEPNKLSVWMVEVVKVRLSVGALPTALPVQHAELKALSMCVHQSLVALFCLHEK